LTIVLEFAATGRAEMSRFQTFEAGNIGHGAEDVAIGFGEAVAPGVVDATNVLTAVGVAVGRGVGRAVIRAVAVGPAVGVGVAVAIEPGVAVALAVAAMVGSAEAVESKPAEPVGAFVVPAAKPTSVGEGLAEAAALLPESGAHCTKATASTTIPTRAAATTGRLAVRISRC
jgi:hypothetical protein